VLVACGSKPPAPPQPQRPPLQHHAIAKGFVRATAHAADDTNAFVYTENDRTLRKVDRSTGAKSVLATDLGNADDLDLESPTHIALDPQFVYVVSRDQNKIVHLRK